MFATLRPPLLARTAAPARAAARPSQRRALSFPSVHRESPFVNGPNLKLNDGNILPDPAFDVGANLPADKVEETVTNALRAGFRHLNTTSTAGHQLAIADAVRACGLSRSRLFLTTTYDRTGTNADGQGVASEFYSHLFSLRMGYVDLLLVGSPRAGQPAHQVWPAMQGLVKSGLVRSIGVKDYTEPELEELLRLPRLTVKPAVNQVEIDAYNTRRTSSLVNLHRKHEIVTHSYAVLDPVTRQPGGPVHVLAEEIGWKKGWPVDRVLIAWAKQQSLGVIVSGTTTAHQEAELAAFVDDGGHLTPDELDAISRAGREWEHPMSWPGKDQLNLHPSSRDAFHRL